MTQHVFYHSADLDGHCSGAVVKRRFPDAELNPINYNQPFSWATIAPVDAVYMVDFGLQPFEQMIRLNASCRLVWIDHHISAIEAYKASGETILGKREVGRGACELTWEYLYPNVEMPRFVYLLSRYDVWDHSDQALWDNEILPFQYGLQPENTDPLTNWEFWSNLFRADNTFYENVIVRGQVILSYVAQTSARYMHSHAYEIQFEGLRALAVNVGNVSSRFFESMYNPAKHDIMIAYSYIRGQFWGVTLYSDKPEVNCAMLAKKYGGGGHRGAAGFSCKDFPFREQ
ncbi:MAG: hypothetical protein WB392_13910 [Methanotrichaceae archaeon]